MAKKKRHLAKKRHLTKNVTWQESVNFQKVSPDQESVIWQKSFTASNKREYAKKVSVYISWPIKSSNLAQIFQFFLTEWHFLTNWRFLEQKLFLPNWRFSGHVTLFGQSTPVLRSDAYSCGPFRWVIRLRFFNLGPKL